MAGVFPASATDLADQVMPGHAVAPHEPDNLLRTLVSQTQLLAGLHWLNKSQVLACIPPGEAVPFENVAEMAYVSLAELSRVIRFTATFGFLSEPQTDLVAHTSLSRHFLNKTSLSDAIMFFGDAVFTQMLKTPFTTQLQDRAAHGHSPFQSLHPGTPFKLDAHYPPRLKRQATAFQRQVLQRALSSERTTADLLGPWMADPSPNTFTVVQVCCEPDAIHVARAIACRHPQLYSVIQLDAETGLVCDGSEDDTNPGHVTIQHCAPISAQRVKDAWLYIIHLPTPSVLPTPVDMLSCATHMLWAHFDILRQNRSSRLVLVANGLVGSAKVNSKAEAATRMYDLLLMQMTTDKQAITMNQMEQLLSTIRDTSWGLVIWRKEISDSHPTVAIEVGLAPI
ncbi:hypothetical protein N0V93_006983 [Gnomoniopsis smithogilvyi]|uniref:Uncharacterized protein n=1 Tax=Gnomoniopsis smithogilvyi TaxID=1191159 RepID=A0A9W8YP86_9PEZI|nr:hypothetical protein N0V93_006983 [Gnomoniopsis smithogilvyi]